jgi:hypothetical protein
MCFTWVGSGLTPEHWAKLERPAGDKRSNLLQTFVNYCPKKFYNIGPWWPFRDFDEFRLFYPTPTSMPPGAGRFRGW